MVQDTTARFVDEKVLPIIGECFEKGRFPKELVPEIASLGLLGSSIQGYDCAGLNGVSYGLICQELERGDSGLRSFVSVQSSLVMYPIYSYGSEEQKQKWLPAMARGEKIGCFGLTEPHGGSDPSNMKTTAKKKGGDWVLNGAKMWITNGTIADVAVVWAQTDEGIRGFLVEKGTKGFDAPEVHHKMSLRASVTSALYFDNVHVPEANRLPQAEGLKGPLGCLTQARYGITWGAIGAAQACLKEVLDYTKTRELFGRPLNHNQLVQLRLAEMSRQITLAQLLSLQLGRLKDKGEMQPVPGVARQVEQLPHGHRHRARCPRSVGRRRHHHRILPHPPRAQPGIGHHLRRHRERASAGDRQGTHRRQRLLNVLVMAELTDFKVLSFDCYGTLIDWESGIRAGTGGVAQARKPESQRSGIHRGFRAQRVDPGTGNTEAALSRDTGAGVETHGEKLGHTGQRSGCQGVWTLDPALAGVQRFRFSLAIPEAALSTGDPLQRGSRILQTFQ